MKLVWIGAVVGAAIGVAMVYLSFLISQARGERNETIGWVFIGVLCIPPAGTFGATIGCASAILRKFRTTRRQHAIDLEQDRPAATGIKEL